MSTTDLSKTAILLIDPYNDFLHPTGKLYPLLAESIRDSNTITHMQDLLTAARAHKIPVFYGLHQPSRAGNFAGWKHMMAVHKSQQENYAFEEGGFGGTIFEGMEPDLGNGDVVVSKHWSSSSFQNTDLNYQLRQREITKVVLAGLTTNHCVEASARYAYDLGYETTLLSDATAGFSTQLKDAATELVWPLFASRVMTTDEFIATLGEPSEK
ncbi:Isochorismatase hydrolase [Aulographum hederae CBS 113979]|uniref:Isochorismatase hydrolase n=1 Tax=Aulographum hederae CBS 113979 TaxID=1176131 RepID=A0A6G1GPM2_9PEZI|nr:Isochorismatase hydrolase [Aulographum hederae CBS 113979]